MKYKSTRGGSTGLSFEDALFTGYAADGGILVPDTIPSVSKEQLKTWSRLGFVDLAKEITSLFVPETEIPKQELNGSIFTFSKQAFNEYLEFCNLHSLVNDTKFD